MNGLSVCKKFTDPKFFKSLPSRGSFLPGRNGSIFVLDYTESNYFKDNTSSLSKSYLLTIGNLFMFWGRSRWPLLNYEILTIAFIVPKTFQVFVIYCYRGDDWKLLKNEEEVETASLSLGELLKKKAEDGVRVLIMIWGETTSIMGTHDTETENFFKGNSNLSLTLWNFLP